MMKKQSTPNRKSIRLKGFSYTGNATYFLTICCLRRYCLFGNVYSGTMIPNGFGKIVRSKWFEASRRLHYIKTDEFVVMPNHIHGLIHIESQTISTMADSNSLGDNPINANSLLGIFVGSFKSAVTRHINAERGTPGLSIWQRNYYEHIIRNDHALDRIREYIRYNPYNWDRDPDNPINY